MSMKPIERLLFAQGRRCFFCEKPLAMADASVEHLVAKANNGSNEDDNCVACCKALNTLLGCKSLKEKIQVVLSQKGEFKCPNGAQKTKARAKPAKSSSVPSLNERYSQLRTHLKKRPDKKPRTVKKLKNAIDALFQRPKISTDDVDALVQMLQSRGVISITGSAITYNSL